jgi:hypothetical protein
VFLLRPLAPLLSLKALYKSLTGEDYGPPPKEEKTKAATEPKGPSSSELARQKKKEEQKGRGGSNKETILLNIKTFKLFCLKTGTKKSHEIHEYFIKLQEILQNIIQEESDELKQQLEEIKNTKEIDRKKFILLEREKLLLREFSTDCSLVYIIKVYGLK